jgi:hypothetical protein
LKLKEFPGIGYDSADRMKRKVIGFSLERMMNAPVMVRERLFRAARALESANIPYAVAGDMAVAM